MSTTRRRLLQGGAALGVAAAIPVGQHVAWSNRDFTREGYSPDYPLPPEGEESWMNWSGIQRATPRVIAAPETEDALVDLISSTQSPLRPKGSGHSFTGLVPSEDTIIDLANFSGLKGINPANGLARFGAGTVLFQAAGALDDHQRAFPNLPDIADQTLAGSCSTATHGTGARLPAMHAQIEAFRMVTAAGEVLEVSAASDADLFAAGQVSLGALGIITEYTLATVPAYNLHRLVTAEPVGQLLDTAEARANENRNFEAYYLPGTGVAATITHNIHSGEVSGRTPSEDDELLLGLKDLRDSFGWWPWLRRKVAGAALPDGKVEDVSDASWRLLTTTRPIRFNEMEYHLPRHEGIAALRKVIAMMDRRKDVFFPMEIRFTAPDDAWLSPFNDGPRISVAIHAAVDEPYEYFFSEFEPVFRAHGGRPHWGKLHSLGHAEVTGLYPDFERFCELRRMLDPDGRLLNPHLAKLFGEADRA